MSFDRIAIMHYHLRRGGVSSVIELISKALAKRNINVVILSGQEPDEPEKYANVRVIDTLDYEARCDDSVDKLAGHVYDEACEALGGCPDVWHVHNHSLGKNSTVPMIVHHFARTGHKLLLHLHDLPEDNRPSNYCFLREELTCRDIPLKELLYPSGPNVHYALLNSRDRDFFASAGACPDRLHLLPNAVQTSSLSDPPDRDRRLFVYPTRAIRRKNLGEFLLHAVVGQDTDRFAVTLKPQNPQAKPIYQGWVDFAEELSLPVEFEAGLKVDSLEAVMTPACSSVTTSVAEGFGLAFLEPWLMGRPVIGRNLPDITRDFVDQGVRLPLLYDELHVPADGIDTEALREDIAHQLRRTRQAYDRPCDDQLIGQAYDSIVRDGQLAFGRIDENHQQSILRYITTRPALRDEFRDRLLGRFKYDDDLIAHNRQVIAEKFNVAAYGQRLENIYTTVTETEGKETGYIDPDQLLDEYLSPDRFTMLRTS